MEKIENIIYLSYDSTKPNVVGIQKKQWVPTTYGLRVK